MCSTQSCLNVLKEKKGHLYIPPNPFELKVLNKMIYTNKNKSKINTVKFKKM